MQTSTKCKVFITFCLVLISQFVIFAQTSNPQDVVYRNYTDYKGNSFSEDFAIIGNNAVTRSGYERTAYNENSSRTDIANNMAFIDVDSDSSTFQSSSADLNISLANQSCLKMKFAYLVWGAVYTNSAQGNPSVVKLKLPGSTAYEDITATISQTISSSNYIARAADITDKVKALSNPNGTYTVANIAASLTTAGTSAPAAGWSIVFVYEDLSHSLPPKSILVERVFGISEQYAPDIDWNGYVGLPDPAKKTIQARVAVVGLGGDKTGGRTIEVNNGKMMGTLGGSINPTTNFFDGTITKNLTNNVTTRVPASTNTLGWDIDDFEIDNTGNRIIPESATRAIRMKFRRDNDTSNYMPLLGVISMDLEIPIFEVQKVVKMKNASGNWVDAQNQKVKNGDEVLYEVTVKNVGSTSYQGAKIELNIPQGATFQQFTDIPSTSIIRETSRTANKVSIDFHQAFTPGTTYKIHYIAKVDIDCTTLRSACGNKLASQDVLTYQSLPGGGANAEIKSHTGTQSCPTTPDETIFYVDDALCVKQEFPFCGPTTLTAGAGYAKYEWRRQGDNTVLSGNATLNISQPGVYEVTRTPVAGQNCFNSEKETFNVYQRTATIRNPLESYAAKLIKCANDNSDYTEIYLCNASKEFNLNLTGINDSDIVWYRYKGTGRTGKETCPPTVTTSDVATDSNWESIGTGKNFILTQDKVGNTQAGSEFALRINYQSCPSTNFFRAFKGSLTFNVEGRNIFCNDGKVIIKDIPTGKYQYQVLKSNQTPSATAWQNIDSTNGNNMVEYPVREEAEYKVFIRPLLEGGAATYQNNVCVYDKTVNISKITEAASLSITHKDVLCALENSGNGELRIQVDNKVPKPFTVTVKRGTHTVAQYNDVLDSQTNTSVNNNLTTLVADTYTIELKSAGCSVTRTEVIGGVSPLVASANASKNTCGSTSENNLKLTIKGGMLVSALAGYNIQITTNTGATTTITRNVKTAQVGSPLETSYDIDFTYPANRNYTNFRAIITDGNGCVLTKDFVVRNTPQPNFNVTKTDANCQYASGSLKVNFTDTNFTTYYSVVEYHLYKQEGSSWEFKGQQSSSTFSKLIEGTYRIEVKYGQQRARLCTYRNDTTYTITTNGNPLLGFVGIKKLACINPVTKARVAVNNVSGGSGQYEYNFGDGVWQASSEKDLDPGIYIVQVRDKNTPACIFEQTIKVEDALQAPSLEHNITYDCNGEPYLSVTPKNTTDYEYSYNNSNNYVNTPLQKQKLAKTSTGYKVYYRQRQSPTPNILIEENFGQGADTCEPRDNILSLYSCALNRTDNQMPDNWYQIKSIGTPKYRGLNNSNWGFPYDHSQLVNGRYLIMNVGRNGDNRSIYHKTVNNVLPNQKIKYTMYVFNLCYSCPYPPVFSIRVVNNITGAVIKESDRTYSPNQGANRGFTREAWNGLAQNKSLEGWEEFSGEIDAPGATSIRIEIFSKSGQENGNDLALDDIRVWQEPEVCSSSVIDIPLTINTDKAFDFSGTPDLKAVTCNGGTDGTARFTLKNVDGATVTYTLYRNNVLVGNRRTTTQSIISLTGLQAGNYRLEIQKRDTDNNITCNKTTNFTINQPNAVSVTSSKTLSDYLNCNQTEKVVNIKNLITATGGNGTYIYKIVGPGLPANTQADANGNVTLKNIGTYTINVEDTNGCRATANSSVTYQLLARNPLVINLTTNCTAGTTINVSHNNANAGATYNYQYKLTSQIQWQDNGTNPNITGLQAGTYDVRVTDSYGCSGSQQIQVGAPITANIKAVPHMTCNGVTQAGGIEINQITGGFTTPNYEVATTNVGGAVPTTGYTSITGTMPFKLPLTAGRYDIYIRDAATTAKCAYRIQTNVEIKADDNFTIQSVTAENPSCENDKGKIRIQVTGEAPYRVKVTNTANTYSREISSNTSPIVLEEIPSDTYNVQVTSARGCTVVHTSTVTLTTPAAMTGSISNETVTACDPNVKAKVKITSPTTNDITGYVIRYSFDRGVTWQTSDTRDNLNDGQVVYGVIGRFLATDLTKPVCTYTLPTHIAKIVTESFDVKYGSISSTNCNFSIPVELTGTTYHSVEYSIDGTTWTAVTTPPYAHTFANLERGRAYTLRVRTKRTATDTNYCEMLHTLDTNRIPDSQVTSTEASSTTCAGSSLGTISYTLSNSVTSWQLLNAETMQPIPNSSGIQGVPPTTLSGTTNIEGTGPTQNVQLTNVPAGKYLLKMVTSTCSANYTKPVEVVSRTGETPFTISATTPVNLSCSTPSKINVTINNGGSRTFRIQLLRAKNPTLQLNIGGTRGRINQGEISISESDFTTAPTTTTTLVVTVTDEFGCAVDTNVTLNPTQKPTFTVAQRDNCNAPYTIEVTPTAPSTNVADFRYSADGGQTYQDSNILNVPAGFDQTLVRVQYRPTSCISDALTSQQIVYSPFKATISKIKEASCGTPAQGVVRLQVASGSGSYTYSVVGQPTMQNQPFTSPMDISLPENATYTIEVTDTKSTASCAKITQQITFDKAELPVFTVAQVNAVGCTTPMAQIILTIPNASNQQGPYTYNLYSAGTLYAGATQSVKEENGNTIVTFSNILPGNTYEPEVVSNRGCSTRKTGGDAVVIPSVPTFTATMATAVPTFNCLTAGQNEDVLKLTINVTGGTAPYTYKLIKTSDNNVLDNNTQSATSYTFTLNDIGEDYEVKWEVKDANGCTANVTGQDLVTISTREKITGVTITQKAQMTCSAAEVVTLAITRSKTSTSTPAYDIDVKNPDGTTPAGATTQTAQPTGTVDVTLPNAEGNYYFVITDRATGCTFTTGTYSVTKVAPPTVTFTADRACFGDTTITFNVLIGGNVQDYSFEITNSAGAIVAQGTGNATNLQRNGIVSNTLATVSGQYKIKVTETNTNCTVEDTILVQQATTAISFNTRVVKEISLDCEGNPLNDGEIDVNTLAQGGFGETYEYQLLKNGVVEVPFGEQTVFKELSAATYVVQVRDKNGCVKDGVAHTLSLPSPLNVAGVNVTSTANTCSVLGTVTVTGVTGGSNNYTYHLYNASTNLLVEEGRESASPSTGTYTFTGISGGTYYVQITDPLLCSPATTSNVVVTPPDVIIPVATVTKYPDCTNNGEITIGVPTVGLAPFTYYQVDPNTNNVMGSALASNVFTNVPNAPTTTYKFKVVDSNGCEGFTNTITVEAVQPISISIITDTTITPHTVTHLTCYGSRSGQIVVRATGGQVGTEYTYTLLDGTKTVIAGISPNNTGEFTNLPEGRYYVRVSQGNTACDIDTTEIIIEQEKEFTAYGVTTNVTCNGANDGKFTINLISSPNLLSGTTRQYTYAISPDFRFVDNGGVFTGLEPGVYTVIMQDQNSCRPTVYSDATTKKLDASGNDVHIFEFTITEPSPLNVGVLSGTYEHESCAGAADGKVKLSINGGTPLEDTSTSPATEYYQYYLDGNTTTPLRYDKDKGLENLSAGSHTVRVVDKNLCEQIVSVEIEAGSNIQVTLDESEGYQCVDGELKYIVNAVVTPSAEATNVTYRLYKASEYPPATLGTGGTRNNSNRFELSVDETLDTDYIIEVTKSVVGHADCRQTKAITVKAQKKVAVKGAPAAEKVNCYGSSDGKITIQAEQGSGNYQFAISPNYIYQTPNSSSKDEYEFTGLKEGFYHIKIKDVTYNCEVEVRDIKVEEYPRLVVEQVSKQNVSCYGKNDGAIQFAFGELDPNTGVRKETGRPLYEFVMYKHTSTGVDEVVASANTLNFNDPIVKTSLAPAKYTLTVTDANGCVFNQDFEILEGVDLNAKVQQVYNCSDDLTQVQTPTYDLYVTVKTPYLGHRYSINDLQYSYDNETTRRNFDLVVNSNGGANNTGVETHDLFVIKNPQSSGAALTNGTHTITLYYKGGQCQGVSETFTIDGYTALTITDKTQADSLNEIKVSISGGKENYMVYFSSPLYNTAAELKTYYSHKQEAKANEDITYYVQRTDADATNASGEKVKQVRVYVEDSKGCGYYITLEKKFYDVQVPNFFTPNGDGNNDYWAPENLISYPNAEVRIFDRYGRHIATLNATQQWDGRYGGQELPAGDYWYFLRLNDPEDNRVLKGHFTLYR
ncbi:MAG: T9SS type B sorting domain-containing protein [Capnocytophaga sp.]|nr:T9SS type B sorting domain-containing protein [Capnocytophaga sp.]